MTAKIIDGNSVADGIKKIVKNEIEDFKIKTGKIPKLIAIQAGENPSSKVYVKNQKESCNEVGIEYYLEQLPEDISEGDFINSIKKYNEDKNVTGIIIQMPLPKNVTPKNIREAVSAKKDVEGITSSNLGILIQAEAVPLTAPCTALAVMELIRSLNIPYKGMEAVVVGHSEIVGKPVALMLLSSLLESATVTVCHIATKDLAFHTKRADLLIVAAGKAGLVKGDMIKEGAIVIDVGINRVQIKDAKGNPVIDEKTGKPKMKTVGDVVYDEAINKAGYITPVPGGVGPVTTAILLKNTLALFKAQI